MTMWGESKTRSEIKRCRQRAHLIHLIGVQKLKKKKKSLTLVFQVHSFGKHKIGKIFYFPHDPTLDRFSDPMLDSKPDKWPQREEMKVSFLFSPSQQFDSQSDTKEHMAKPICCWSQWQTLEQEEEHVFLKLKSPHQSVCLLQRPPPRIGIWHLVQILCLSLHVTEKIG